MRDRKIETIVTELAKAHGISHQIFSNGWVHVFEKEEKISRLIGFRWSLNDSAASSIASDKVATSALLADADIPAVPHILIRSKGDKAPRLPENLPNYFILKPLNGTSGHGIASFSDAFEAMHHMQEHSITEWALSPYLKIKREVRIILLGDECLLAYEKTQPITKNGVTFFNLGKGAVAKNVVPSEAQYSLANTVRKAIGLQLAAVDIIEVRDSYHVLEINDGIMMENYLRQSSEYYENAVTLYERVLLASLS